MDSRSSGQEIGRIIGDFGLARNHDLIRQLQRWNHQAASGVLISDHPPFMNGQDRFERS